MKHLFLTFPLLVMMAGTVSAQFDAKPEALPGGIVVDMTRDSLLSYAAVSGWKVVKSTQTLLSFHHVEPAFSTSDIQVAFAGDQIASVTYDIRFSKSGLKRAAGIIAFIHRAIVNRAERTEKKNGQTVYIHTAPDGTTVRTIWIQRSAGSIRNIATCSR